MKQYEQEAIVYGKKKGMVSILMGLFGMSWYISLLWNVFKFGLFLLVHKFGVA